MQYPFISALRKAERIKNRSRRPPAALLLAKILLFLK